MEHKTIAEPKKGYCVKGKEVIHLDQDRITEREEGQGPIDSTFCYCVWGGAQTETASFNKLGL